MTTTFSSRPPMTEAARAVADQNLTDAVTEVRDAINNEPVVVVGMGWNPFVRKAMAALDEAGITYTYLGYGNYLVGWKRRLQIKLWTGWPTFPQVFVRGTLVGGNADVRAALADGSLCTLLNAESTSEEMNQTA